MFSSKFRLLFDIGDKTIGDYIADLMVESEVLIELKTARAIDNIHRAQCMNYLKATRLHVCLLINFGNPKLEVKRIVCEF